MTPATVKVIVDALKKAGINFIASLPELNLQPLVQAVHDDDSFIHEIGRASCRERV